MASRKWRQHVLDYAAFGTMQLGFTIFTKLFHSVQFLLLWSFLRKLLRRLLTATNKSKTEPFWLCFTHGLRLFPHNQASGFSSEEDPPLYGSAFQASPTRGAAERAESPGERTDRAGLCKAHKARLCELERNPRQRAFNQSSNPPTWIDFSLSKALKLE